MAQVVQGQDSYYRCEGYESSREKLDQPNSNTSTIAAKTRQPSSFVRFTTRLWLIEIGGWLVSAGFMGAIIGVLKRFEGEPVPQLKWHFTLNALVSLLATLMKASVLIPVAESIGQLKWLWFDRQKDLDDIQTFDSASRGLRGAISLLWTTRVSHLASIGALLTLLCLGLDAFVQQLVTYPLRSDFNVGVATVPRAQGYSDVSFGSIAAIKTPSLSMKTAIYNGLFNGYKNPAALQMIPMCTTSNCTFATPYTSLAICSQCRDITPALITSNDKRCDLSLPNGMLNLTGNSGLMNMTTGVLLDAADLAFGWPVISNVTFITKQDPYSCSPATATQCVLHYCVNTYTGIVTQGLWTETIVSSWTPTLALPSSLHDLVLTAPPALNLSGNTTFTITMSAWIALAEALPAYLTGYVYGSGGEESSSSDAARAFYDEGNATATLANLALGMTQALRQTPLGGANATASSARGTAWATQSYVRVRWAWITMPVVLQALALAFLGATILQTRRRGAPVWKSSTLPLLRLGLDGARTGRLRRAETLWEMGAVAKEVSVRLECGRGGDAWLFEGPGREMDEREGLERAGSEGGGKEVREGVSSPASDVTFVQAYDGRMAV